MDRFHCLDIQGAPLTPEIVKSLILSARATILCDTLEAQALGNGLRIDIKTEFREQSVEDLSGIRFEATITTSKGERTKVIFLFSKDDDIEESCRPLWPLPVFLQEVAVEPEFETDIPPLGKRDEKTYLN